MILFDCKLMADYCYKDLMVSKMLLNIARQVLDTSGVLDWLKYLDSTGGPERPGKC